MWWVALSQKKPYERSMVQIAPRNQFHSLPLKWGMYTSVCCKKVSSTRNMFTIR